MVALHDQEWVYLLRITDSQDLERVRDFLTNAHVSVRDHDDGVIRVSIAGAPTPAHERREITGYVTTWNALNPRSPVELTSR